MRARGLHLYDFTFVSDNPYFILVRLIISSRSLTLQNCEAFPDFQNLKKNLIFRSGVRNPEHHLGKVSKVRCGARAGDEKLLLRSSIGRGVSGRIADGFLTDS